MKKIAHILLAVAFIFGAFSSAARAGDRIKIIDLPEVAGIDREVAKAICTGYKGLFADADRRKQKEYKDHPILFDEKPKEIGAHLFFNFSAGRDTVTTLPKWWLKTERKRYSRLIFNSSAYERAGAPPLEQGTHNYFEEVVGSYKNLRLVDQMGAGWLEKVIAVKIDGVWYNFDLMY